MDEQVSDNADDRERSIWYVCRKLRRASSAEQGIVWRDRLSMETKHPPSVFHGLATHR
jgi:hypothetical protein